MKIDEELIIEQMKSPKTREEGLRMLMSAYQSRLYWHIRRLVVQHDDAQDLLQDTFVKSLS
jgi:RNA polymerase sigma-70 factor (ECF subfamily)